MLRAGMINGLSALNNHPVIIAPSWAGVSLRKPQVAKEVAVSNELDAQSLVGVCLGHAGGVAYLSFQLAGAADTPELTERDSMGAN